jgi:hypothetical protein
MYGEHEICPRLSPPISPPIPVPPEASDCIVAKLRKNTCSNTDVPGVDPPTMRRTPPYMHWDQGLFFKYFLFWAMYPEISSSSRSAH